MYLEDDFTREARFPTPLTGNFETTFWEDRLSLQVMGDSANQNVTEELPSPRDLGLISNNPQRPGPSGLNQKTTSRSSSARGVVGASSQKSHSFQRVVFLADFDSEYKIVKSHTAHLKLTTANSNVHDVAKLTKEYLNLEEDLTIVDSHGFEVMDSSSTRGDYTFHSISCMFLY